MFAILEIGGKQYKAKPEQRIVVGNLNQEVGKKITFDKIFCIEDDAGKTTIGQPKINGAKVEAKINRNFKGDKVLIFKKRRRKNSRRKRGYRQQHSEIKVLSIKS